MGDVADAVKMHYTALPVGLFEVVKIRNKSEEPDMARKKPAMSLMSFLSASEEDQDSD